MNNKLKTFIALMLALALLPGALAGGFFSGLLSGGSDKLRFVSVKDKAFSTDNSRVIAATGDGRNVLIMNAFELYLWDTMSGKRFPVWFSGEKDIEQLDFTVQTAYARRSNVKKEQMEALKQKYDEITGAYFGRSGITRFTTLDEVSECFPMIISIGARTKELGSRWALVEATYLSAMLLIDLETGEARFTEDRYASINGDRLLNSDDGSVTDLVTGETYYPEYKRAETDYFFGNSKAIRLLDDDSVLVLIPKSEIREDKTQDMLLHHISVDGGQITDLGSFDFMREPSELLVTGNGRYAAAYYPQVYYADQAVIVDLETGEVITPEIEDLLFTAATEDAFLCYDFKNAEMVKLDPETLKRSKLGVSGLGRGSYASYTMMGSLVGNGRGLYFSQGEILRGYFELDK